MSNKIFLLAEKVGMTQIFGEDGQVNAATLLNAGPVEVVGARTEEKDGYAATVYGFKKDGEVYKYLFEVKGNVADKGSVVTVKDFEVGNKIRVSGHTKGKGFQGGMKKHGFHGGPASHGQKHNSRTIGSIGGGGRAGGRVVKGKKMPGRDGGNRVTVKNLQVLFVDAENNRLYVKGAVPGRRGTLLEVVSQ